MTDPTSLPFFGGPTGIISLIHFLERLVVDKKSLDNSIPKLKDECEKRLFSVSNDSRPSTFSLLTTLQDRDMQDTKHVTKESAL